MSSSSSSILVRWALLVLVAGVGFGVGRMTSSSTRIGEEPEAGTPSVQHDAGSPPSSSNPGSSVDAANHATADLSPEARWSRWASVARTAEAERELRRAIEDMARSAPDRAMELAAREPNLRSRELLRHAALRGWASIAPDAALAAAMKLRAIDNRAAIGAVLQGAAGQPETVLRLARQITDGSDPVALDYGNLAITALAERGHFEDAVRFASSGAPANRAQWLNEVFGAWAREQPQAALAALEHVTDPTLHHEALEGLVAGWAQSDPASLADHALREPNAEDRTMELGQTLTNWVLRDPAAASAWLNQRDPDPALDAGLSTVATMPVLMAQRPETAAEWAASISDPRTRETAFRAIGDEWRQRSPTTLQQFLQANSRLSETDRAALAGSERQN